MIALRGARTLADMAAMFDVSIAAVQRYEGGRVPRGEILQRIARKTNKSVEWLLTGREHTAGDRAAEEASLYGDLARPDINTIKELQALLEVADDDIKNHLRQQIRLLWRAVKTPAKRGAGKA